METHAQYQQRCHSCNKAHLFGALAQFERDLIRERTRAGLQAAEERGRYGGRQAVVTPEKLAKAPQYLAAGSMFAKPQLA